MTFTNEPIGEATIGCCLCLNMSGQHVSAVAIINGYACCDAHINALSSDFSDFAQLVNRVKGDIV